MNASERYSNWNLIFDRINVSDTSVLWEEILVLVLTNLVDNGFHKYSRNSLSCGAPRSKKRLDYFVKTSDAEGIQTLLSFSSAADIFCRT